MGFVRMLFDVVFSKREQFNRDAVLKHATSSVGQIELLLMVGISLIFGGMLVWLGIGGHAGDFELTYFKDALWLSWTIFFDPGTQTGFSPSERDTVLWFSAIFSVIGFSFNLVILGWIVDRVRSMLERWRRANDRITARDHAVVLGWTDQTLFLIGELAQYFHEVGFGSIVVVGELTEAQMLSEIRMAFPGWHRWWRNVKVHCWKGKPNEVEDLKRVSVSHARFVIVLGDSRDPREADYGMVSTLCALRCLPDQYALPPRFPIFADFQIKQNSPVAARLVAPSLLHVAFGREVADRCLAFCALRPTEGQVRNGGNAIPRHVTVCEGVLRLVTACSGVSRSGTVCSGDTPSRAQVLM